ncbi:MAG: NADH:flavin oxidoreductase [Chloroflexi bacterium]|nr:NADH:flavin oxidoreductase [Chloroflexota bacterium]
MRMRLFTPIWVGGVRLDNRIVFPAFEHNTATEDGFVTQATLDFHTRIAAGGVGLIITGATVINPDPSTKQTKYILDLSHDRFIPGHRKLAEAMHQEGAKAFVQIADKTSLALGKPAVDFTVEEIERIIEYFAAGARRVKEAGFDGVDYHFAHRYTGAQFLSRMGNKRQDEWGGSAEGRARFAVEIMKRSREYTGPDFVLAPRFNGDEFLLGGNTLKDAMRLAQLFVAAGADMLDISAGGHTIFPSPGTDLGRTVPGPEYEDCVNVHLAERIRKAVNAAVPVLTAGKIGRPDLAEEVLAEEKADLVGISRGLFLDPNFPRKTREGRWGDIIECIYCNACHLEYRKDKVPTCSVLAKLARRGSAEARRLNEGLVCLDKLRSKVV